MYRKGGIRMWIFYAFGSALFAGLTSILAKCGTAHTDSDVADGDPHDRGFLFFHGLWCSSWGHRTALRRIRQDMAVSDSLRGCDGSILAVLLSCLAGR